MKVQTENLYKNIKGIMIYKNEFSDTKNITFILQKFCIGKDRRHNEENDCGAAGSGRNLDCVQLDAE